MKALSDYIPSCVKQFVWLSKKRGFLDLMIDIFYNIFIRKRKVPYYLNRTSAIIHSKNLHIHPDSLTTMISLSVSPRIYIQCNNEVYIGNNVLIAPDVKIISSNHSKTLDRHWVNESPIFIDDNIWIGTSAIILPGVSISKGITIGAGTVVSKSLHNSHKTYVGNPARIVS